VAGSTAAAVPAERIIRAFAETNHRPSAYTIRRDAQILSMHSKSDVQPTSHRPTYSTTLETKIYNEQVNYRKQTSPRPVALFAVIVYTTTKTKYRGTLDEYVENL